MSISHDLDNQIQRLGIESDEIAVISLMATKSDGQATIAAGSVVVGERALASQSWPEWYRANRNGLSPIGDLLARTHRPVDSWIEFDHFVDEWRFVRFVLESDHLPAWLASATEDGVVRLPGDGTALPIAVAQPSSPMRILGHETTSASRLAAATGRSMVGWVYPLLVHLPEQRDPIEMLEPPQDWIIDGVPIPGGALFLAGFSSTESYRPDGQPTPPLRPGLLVGRLERRAWLADMRGGEDLQTFDVSIRSDPRRIAMWDLDLDIEERDGDELLSARRLRLTDVALPPLDTDAFTVRLPTLGASLVRRVRLFDRSGVLLDGSDPFRLIERIDINADIGGAAGFTTSVGRIEVSTLASRLDRQNRVDAEYAALLKGGLAGRIVAPGAQGRVVVVEMLRAARNELLIFDPFFGKDPTDWDAVRDVALAMRVLTGRQGARPSGGVTLTTQRLDMRRWQGPTHSPEFHDRAYLWEGGGFLVGTSPSGLGNRLALIDPVSPVVAAELCRHFEGWWTDSRFGAI